MDLGQPFTLHHDLGNKLHYIGELVLHDAMEKDVKAMLLKLYAKRRIVIQSIFNCKTFFLSSLQFISII